MKRWLIILIIFIIILVTYFLIFNNVIKTTTYHMESEKIPFNLKIAQISDVHNRKANKIYPLVNELQPDIVLITGDLFDSYNPDYENVEELLRKIDYPMYFVSGNHENRLKKEYEKIKALLLKYNVTILEDDIVKYEKNDKTINIAGIQDKWFESEGLNKINIDADYTILLSHRPELFEDYVSKGVDLVFSGHIHGGLVQLPFVGAIFSPNEERFFPKYYQGIYEKNMTKMIVSTGLGDSRLRFKINVVSELVVVNIKTKD